MTPAPNTPNTPRSPEDDLAVTLRHQADRFAARGGAGLDFEQVVSRAGEIRRGRRMRATMVMAAVVVAVAVPVGITVVGNDPATNPAPPAATTTPIEREPDPSALSLGKYPLGKAPAQGYAYGDKLYGPGDPVPFGNGGETSGVARLDGGFLVAQYDESSNLVASFVSDDGTVGETWPMESGFAVSPDHQVGAFVTTSGDVTAVQDGGESFDLGRLPSGVAYQVHAMTGEDCDAGTTTFDCTVYVEVNRQGEPNQQVYAVTPGQEPEPVFDGLLNVAGISSDGLVAGQVSFSDEGSCWEVRDADGTALWETCENSLDSFSPDGGYILAGPAYLDGPGGGGLTILDASTGEPVLDLETVPNAFVSGPRWEDENHVLAPVYDTATWGVLRIALDGNREYATDKAPDDDSYVSPYKLG